MDMKNYRECNETHIVVNFFRIYSKNNDFSNFSHRYKKIHEKFIEKFIEDITRKIFTEDYRIIFRKLVLQGFKRFYYNFDTIWQRQAARKKQMTAKKHIKVCLQAKRANNNPIKRHFQPPISSTCFAKNEVSTRKSIDTILRSLTKPIVTHTYTHIYSSQYTECVRVFIHYRMWRQKETSPWQPLA